MKKNIQLKGLTVYQLSSIIYSVSLVGIMQSPGLGIFLNRGTKHVEEINGENNEE